MIEITQLIGWIGNFLFLIGALCICKKNILGFYIQAIANGLYIWQSIILNNTSLCWLSIILGIVNIYGIYKWKENKYSINYAEIKYANAVCNLYDEPV